jgi:thiol-disulfide isomerase/thioredoxin
MKQLSILSVALLLLVACNTTKPAVASAEEVVKTETVQPTVPAKPTPPAKPVPPAVKKPKAKTMLVGKEPREALTKQPFGAWYTKNYKTYTVKEDLTPAIKKGLKGVEITTFMGTWCGDSKRETPRMLKILDAADFKEKNFELITVDRSKSKPTEYTAGNNIIRVPTFIFKKDGKEIGRIVERPVESLEADMLKILNGEPYKHSYEK